MTKPVRNKEIRRLVVEGQTPLVEIAKRFGASRARISQIAPRKRNVVEFSFPLNSDAWFALLDQCRRMNLPPEDAAKAILERVLTERKQEAA